VIISGWLVPRDALIFLACVALALVLAWLSVRKARPDESPFAIRIYLFMMEVSNIPSLKEYAASHKQHSRREQFLASAFVWFFIFFVIAIFMFDCPKRGC